MLEECGTDEDKISLRIAGVLEFLTMRAVTDAAFMISTDDGDAIALFAANEAADDIRNAVKDLPIKDWMDPLEPLEDFTTNSDPGDEQKDNDEPTPEQK
jgi:hypothetical protein